MKDSKFYHFLSSLSKKEIGRFRRYLESPYFNVNPQVLNLFSVFESHLLNGGLQSLEKERVWELVYPDEPFDYGRLRKLLHILMEHGENFLAQQIYDHSPLQQANYLLESVYEKNLDFLHSSALSGAKLQLKKQLNKSGIYYFYLYDMERKRYHIENFEGKRVEKLNLQNINLNQINLYLDIFFIAEKLKVYCSLLSWKSLIDIETSPLFIEQILNLAGQKPYIEYPPIAIYYQIYLTQKEFDDESHYYKLKELIHQHIHNFPPNEAKDIIDSAINYTIKKHNTGKMHFFRENFELYKSSLENEIIYLNNEITPWTFKNIVTLALRLNEFAWTEDFIESFKHKINPAYRENAINYNRAVLHFYKKEFDKVIPLLQKVQFDEAAYGLASRTMLIAVFYELRDSDALFSYFDSLKSWLRRTKSTLTDRKDRYIDLINFTKKLIEYENASHEKIVKLKQDIIQSNSASKKWLLEKVDELLA